MCGALTHKKCTNLVLLTPWLKDIVEADVRRLKTSNAILKTKLNSSKVALDEFITHCEVVAGEVKSRAQEMQNKVKEWEEKNLKYLLSFRNEKVSEMEKRIADGTAALNKTKKTIETASKGDGSVESFVSVKVDISTAQHALDKCSKSVYSTPGSGWHINIDNSMHQLPQDLKIPKVVENSNVLKNIHKVSKMKSKCKFDGVVDVTVVTINDVEIAVCPVYNAHVNLFAFAIDSPKSFTHMKIQTVQNPWAVAKFPPGRVIANSSDTTELFIVEIKEDLSKSKIFLSVSKTLRTSKRYQSLAALSTDTFAAGTSDPPSIDILHLSGIILKSFDNHTLGHGTLNSPFFICVDHDLNLLVSDCGTKTVSCISLDGSVLFRFPQHWTKEPVLERPHGVTVDKDGSIFVVDHRRDEVVQFTKTGDFVRKVVGPEHLKNPHGVAFDSNGNMVIAQPNGVFVFKFQ